MKEWFINGVLVGYINIPINYLTRKQHIISSDDFYYLNAIIKSIIIVCTILYFRNINIVCFAFIPGIFGGLSNYLYINTRDISDINPKYSERIFTMVFDALIWGTWNAMCFGGGCIIISAVLIIDNVDLSDWFLVNECQENELQASLIDIDNTVQRTNIRNHQYIASIILKTFEYISLRSILTSNTEYSASTFISILGFYTLGNTLTFITIKLNIAGPFILDNYRPVENLRDTFLSFIFIALLELFRDCGILFVLSYRQNIGYALIVIDSYRLIEESVKSYYLTENALINDCRIISIIIYIYGGLFFYPTFIFLN